MAIITTTTTATFYYSYLFCALFKNILSTYNNYTTANTYKYNTCIYSNSNSYY